MKEVIRYKCDYCESHYASKYDAQRHEQKCLCNPVNKSCSTCNHASKYFCEFSGREVKEIYIHGVPIRDCKNWEAAEQEEQITSEVNPCSP